MSRKKSRNWTEMETVLLLELYKEREIIKKMDSKEIRHSNLYKELEVDLKAHDLERDAKQIKSRMKTLKVSEKYFLIKRELGKSGSGRKINWPHYEIMHELLGPRPTANRKGVDSAKAIVTFKENAPPEPDANQNSTSPDKSPYKDESVSSDSVASIPDERSEESETEIVARFPQKKRYSYTMMPLTPAKSANILNRSADNVTTRENNVVLTPPPPVSSQTDASFQNLNDTVVSSELESGTEESEFSIRNAVLQSASTSKFSEKQETEKKDKPKEDEPKMTKRQKLQKEKDELIEILFKQQSARTEALMNKEEELQVKAVNDISKIKQQNTLLLVQAFAMAQNSSTSSSTASQAPIYPMSPTYPMFSPYFTQLPQQMAGISPACSVIPNMTTWNAGNNTADVLPVIPNKFPYYSHNLNPFFPPMSSLGQPASSQIVGDMNSSPSFPNVANSCQVTTSNHDGSLNADSTPEETAPTPIFGNMSASPCLPNMGNSYPLFSVYKDASPKLDSFNLAPDRVNESTSNASVPALMSDSGLHAPISNCDIDANLKTTELSRMANKELVSDPVVDSDVLVELKPSN